MLYRIFPRKNEYYLRKATLYSEFEDVSIIFAKQQEDIAKIYKKTQNHNRSIKFYEIAAEIYGYNERYLDVANCLFKIANILIYKSKYQEAKLRYNAIKSLTTMNHKLYIKSDLRAQLCDFALGKLEINGFYNSFLNEIHNCLLNSDVLKFINVCENYDRQFVLKPVETSILVQIKNLIEKRSEEIL
jgi:tetratricopeptide (TPR) repeat protein